MTRRPNIVLILTDNQGAWTLGCHGNPDISTPHIDKLASQGIRFANAYCVNSVCSPSRATWLTGLIPSRHGVHCYLGLEKPSAEIGPSAYCTIREFKNLPQTLADAGYTCGLSGKWHLGDTMHPQLGFQYWFAKLGGHTHSFVDAETVWQGRVSREPRSLTEVITEHALDFLDQHHNKPFFLYVPYNGPYGLGEWLLHPHCNSFTDYYTDKELSCFPRELVHPWLRQNREFVGNITAMRAYAAEVSEVDAQVGHILAALQRHGVADDTVVVFTADQGLCGGHHGMWGMGDHSRPIHTFEETIHIPLVIRHGNGIPPRQVYQPRVCNYDFLTSLLEYVGLDTMVTDSPGVSFAAAMRGQPCPRDGVIFHEFENTRMVRTDQWKYTRRHPDGPDDLYNMNRDPLERTNLAGEAAHRGVIAELRSRIDGFFNRYGDAKYDLWRGGAAKSGSLLGR